MGDIRRELAKEFADHLQSQRRSAKESGEAQELAEEFIDYIKAFYPSNSTSQLLDENNIDKFVETKFPNLSDQTKHDRRQILRSFQNYAQRQNKSPKMGVFERLKRHPVIIRIGAIIGIILMVSGLGEAVGLPPNWWIPTFLRTLIPIPHFTLANESALLGFPGNPVIHNTEWKPQTHSLNHVLMAFVPVGCLPREQNKPDNERCINEPFWIDVHEVTNYQFDYFQGVANRGPPNGSDSLEPRANVTWFEARDFCIKRSAQLPSSLQWEYAARGPDGMNYPWGTDWNSNNLAWGGNSNIRPAPEGGRVGAAQVGSYPSGMSWVGALDMSGNVWEWTDTIYQTPTFVGSDASTDAVNTDRQLRGGSWGSELPEKFLPAFVYGNSPHSQGKGYGFRCIVLASQNFND